MKTFKWLSSKTRKGAFALIAVLGVLALATVLLLAIFSSTETEFKATQASVSAQSAKQLADIATAIVQAQIQNGQNNDKQTNQANRTTHATQPGCVRVYTSSGAFSRGYKLYSSSQMVATNETNLVTGKNNAGTLLVPADWDDSTKTINAARFVDLNQPVVRDPIKTGAAPAVFFPVIDPRAAYNFIGSQNETGIKTTAVEGFEYSKDTKTGTGAAVIYNSVKTPSDPSVTDPSMLRLPMPVEWIYVLQDGSMGAIDPVTELFVPAITGKTPSDKNPIVGRIAFWADDESCKINVNTASEPTYMGTPYYYHDRDRRWAHYPAASAEYQRFPGHPATVALSSVLCPNYLLDPVSPDAGLSTKDVVALKEQIYDLAPKISRGGSQAGTLPFVLDEFKTYWGESEVSTTKLTDNATARAKRLFASVDEMLFKDDAQKPNISRTMNQLTLPGSSGRVLFDHDTLERTRFFLTAHSRAPEFSIHGLPRVCMWPVSDEVKSDPVTPNPRRTNFDNMIALCASLKAPNGVNSADSYIDNSYVFRRSEPHHSTLDVTGAASGSAPSKGLKHNRKLLEYLEAQMNGLNYPKTGPIATSTASTFLLKYGADNVRQLCVEMFDYIRCINLYDGILAQNNDGSGGSGKSGKALYDFADQIAPDRYTYTNQRVSGKATTGAKWDKTDTTAGSNSNSVLPGHGQVTPAVWDQPQGSANKYMGFGRMFTLSEVGFQFICTGDGQTDDNSVDFNGVKSGGLGAPRFNPTSIANEPGYIPVYNKDVYGALTLPDKEARWWSNFPPMVPHPTELDQSKPLPYGVNSKVPAHGAMPGGKTNEYHPALHPGYFPENWNMTLANNTPLHDQFHPEGAEKRVQAIFLMETFCPMLGWTRFFPEYTIVLDGNYLNQIKLTSDGKQHTLFDGTSSITVKSNSNLYDANSVYPLGGHAGPAGMTANRAIRPIAGEGDVKLGSDPNYDTTGSNSRSDLNNYALTSNYITVKRDKDMIITFPPEPMKILIYDKHNYTGLQPVQTLYIKFDKMTVPTPLLVGGATTAQTSGLRHYIDNTTRSETYYRALQGPHFWAYNTQGAVGRMKGRPSPAYKDGDSSDLLWTDGKEPEPVLDSDLLQETRGRLDVATGVAGPTWKNKAPPGGAAQKVPIIPDTISDVIRTSIPAIGDYRLIAARNTVPAEMWKPNPYPNGASNAPSTIRTIHSFSSMGGDAEPGFKTAFDATGNYSSDLQYGAGVDLRAKYSDGSVSYARIPDLPGDPADKLWPKIANSFGDFDAGISSARDGPYINKPDEGNFFANNESRTNSNSKSVTKFYRISYFYNSWQQADDWRSGVFMTPNRLVSSPVMFGSLPTGVWPGGSVPQTASAYNKAPLFLGASFNDSPRPWQTLLFRPYPISKNTQGASAQMSQQATHPGQYNPMDHYLLDLFFMPVVEPYAISEPLAEAGKINMNYQILPFTNIKRATGMNAVLKGEFITAIPNSDAVNAKKTKGFDDASWDKFYDESDPTAKKFWHRPVDVKNTLLQFDERFNFKDIGVTGNSRGLFRSASQICETYLIPNVAKGFSSGEPGKGAEQSVDFSNLTASTRPDRMVSFWNDHATTGDNVKEKPYSNIYSRVTTRSNTFRVHVRSQVIKKARSSNPSKFESNKDVILSEYRGSTVLERFIDPNDVSKPLPEYAKDPSVTNPLGLAPLDSFYQFREIETKRFNP